MLLSSNLMMRAWGSSVGGQKIPKTYAVLIGLQISNLWATVESSVPKVYGEGSGRANTNADYLVDNVHLATGIRGADDNCLLTPITGVILNAPIQRR